MSAYFKVPASDRRGNMRAEDNRLRRDPLFSFQGFEMYAARREDLWLAMLWTGMDEHHRDLLDPLFFIEASPGVETYIVADRQGWLFFIRLSRGLMKMKETGQTFMMVRVHIQFAPYASAPGKPLLPPPACVPLTTEARRRAVQPINRIRTMRALVLGCEWIQRAMEPLGISALCFESESLSLIRFCQKRLGFCRRDMWLIKWFKAAEQPNGIIEALEKSGDYSQAEKRRA